MDEMIANRLEYDENVKVIHSDAEGVYYIAGASLASRQHKIGICGQYIIGMPEDASFFSKKQLEVIAAELPGIIELYC